jgi:hypothetical protein
MGMGHEYRIDFLPFQIQAAQRNLCSLAPVKQKQIAVSTQKHGGAMAVWERHHATAAQNKSFHIHSTTLA